MPAAPERPANTLRLHAPAPGWLARLATRAAPLGRLLPAQCAVCHTWPGQMVCADCNAAHAQPRLRCRCCAIGLPAGISAGASAGVSAGADAGTAANDPVCADCLRQPPAHTAGCHAAVSYQWPWRGLIDRFKFHQQPGLALPLALLMLQNADVADALRQADLLLPMPLHRLRLAERGYNQSLLLARSLHRLMRQTHGLPAQPLRLLPSALLRTRHTQPQSTLPFAERQRNLRGAFAVNPRQADLVKNARVVLLDDVMTTGASLQAAAQALQQAGCAQVVALALARTEKH